MPDSKSRIRELIKKGKHLSIIKSEKMDYFTLSNNDNRKSLRYTLKDPSKEGEFKVYSVGIYVPKRDREQISVINTLILDYTQEDLDVSRSILYSKLDKENITKYNRIWPVLYKNMSAALKVFIEQMNIKGNVHLVSLPSSKISNTRKLISLERDFVKTASRKINIEGCNLIDDSDLIIRTCDIDAQHEGGERSVSVQINSITCTKALNENEEDTYILIDDIVTSGTIMAAGRKMLTLAGADINKIYCLTFLATRDSKKKNPFYEEL